MKESKGNSKLFESKVDELKFVNGKLLMCNMIMFFFMAFPVIADAMMGKMVAIIRIAMIILFAIVGNVLYRKDKASVLFRQVSISNFAFVYAYSVFTAPSAATISYILPIMFTMVLYSDVKLTKIISGITIVTVLIRFALGIMGVHESGTALFFLGGVMLTVAVYSVTVVKSLQRFNQASMSALESEKDAQANMIQDILQIAETVQSESQAIGDIMEHLVHTNEVVTKNVQEVSTGIVSVTENINEQTLMTGTIQGNIQTTQERTQHVEKLAETSQVTIEENLKHVNELKHHSQKISTVNNTVADHMNRLREKAKEVQNITGVIAGVAGQTNLLALNASIEAARAGEAGKGFAVVAEEIRNLSEQTKQASENINTILNELSSYAADASESVQESLLVTDKQTEYIQRVNQGFDNIYADINTMDREITEMSAEMKQLANSNNEIVDNISQISAASEEMTVSLESTAEDVVANEGAFVEMQSKFQNVLNEIKNFEKYQ